MKWTHLLFVLPLLSTLAACAGLEVKDVSSVAADDEARGVRYYESSPYLLVHTDNQGGIVTRILYLPDRTKKRSIRPYSQLARGTSTLQFENGVLTSSQTELDAAVVPKAIVSALEKAAIAFLAANQVKKAPEEEKFVPGPRLFKIVIHGDSVTLKIGNGVAPIHVDLPKGE
jgi:hypothetical protein